MESDMNRLAKLFFTTLLISALTSACDDGTTDAEGAGGADGGGSCSATEYLAFDPTNHAPQDLRLAKIDEMLGHFATAAGDPTHAADAAAAILAIYEDPEANLAAKVLGRKDAHFTGAAAESGAAIDAAIRDGITRLGAATTAHEVAIAKQIFEKAGVQRWLYLSVYQELAEPSREHYDEAYGYFGSGATNAEAGRRSMSLLATKRDGNNETTLADELFVHLLDGRCALDAALDAAGVEELALGDDPAYAAIVATLDGKLRLLFAYSVGHELIELDAERSDVESAVVKLYEGEGFFRTIEPWLQDADATLAADLRTAFDDAITKTEAGDTSWLAAFPALELLGRLETHYAIDVKG